jgi:ribose 5-phosphate isomerase A
LPPTSIRRDIGRSWRVAEALEYGIVGPQYRQSSRRSGAVRRHQGIRHRAARARSTASRIISTPLDELGRLDLTVDGADQIDPSFRLIKGGGGALLAEKIVAAASDRMVVIADAAKYAPVLGAFPLPIEIVPFAHRTTARAVEVGISAFITHGADARFRLGASGEAFVTDGGHYIFDVACGEIREPEKLAQFLSGVPGVVDHGLFIGLASTVVLGRGDKAEVIEARV